jgi:PAS domain S-box-containing protein
MKSKCEFLFKSNDVLMPLEKKIVNKKITQTELHFKYLPDYAYFLLKNRLEEFSMFMLNIIREEKVPLLKYYETFPEQKIIELSLKSAKELLEYFIQNKVQEYIDVTLKNWITDRLHHIKTEQISAKDVTSFAFIRRKVFRNFLGQYTSELPIFIAIMDEVDQFTSALEEASFDALFRLHEQKMDEHHHFIEKINNTSPGIIYVFDLLENKEIYSNNKKEELLGFTEREIKKMGEGLFSLVLQPQELLSVKEHYKKFVTAKDGEVRTIENKIKKKMGCDCWLRSYETVFKRTAKGAPSQIIGISIDITKEKEITRQLEHRDQQLQEAQEIAGFGTFEWDLVGDNSVYSPQLLEIFELENKSKLDVFVKYIHPSDLAKLEKAIADSFKDNGSYECQYRYKKGQYEKVIWSSGKVTFQNNKPVKMQGFVMDVTQNYLLSMQVKESEYTFHQLIQNAPDAVIVLDEKSEILLWNPQAEEIFGWTSDEIIGEKLLNTIIPEQYQNEYHLGIKKLNTQGKGSVLNKTIEITAVNKKGKEFFIALSVSNSHWNGKPVFISFIRYI